MTTETDNRTPAARAGFGLHVIVALLVVAFVGGVAVTIWLSNAWRDRNAPAEVTDATLNSTDAQGNSAAAVLGSEPAQPQPVPRPAPGSPDEQAMRVAELEQRLTRIAVAAQAASANANRAEAIMTAFAARRALDAGRPLGYVENALRVRFGEAQPKAVATIINAAQEPVTLPELRVGLEDIGAVPRLGASPGDWWAGAWRELRELAVIRRAGQPSPDPELRLQRARRDVEAGRVDAAITELSALPPTPQVERWLELARRYNEAHRALDVIEAAAILEPRAAAATLDPAAISAAIAAAGERAAATDEGAQKPAPGGKAR